MPLPQHSSIAAAPGSRDEPDALEADEMLPQKLRYHVVLNVSSIQHDDQGEDSATTYLDQGSIYKLSITDSAVKRNGHRRSPQYKTFVGVYFAPGQHTADHYARLRRWNNHLPMNPVAHAQSLTPAIGYAIEGNNASDQAAPSHMQISDVCFDSFQVRWTPNQATADSSCTIPFRLNFLNIDFSRKEAINSKAMTLFVRTEEVSPVSEEALELRDEGCILKVNVFFECFAEQRYLLDCQQLGRFKIKHPESQGEPMVTSKVGTAIPISIENPSPPESSSTGPAFNAGNASPYAAGEADLDQAIVGSWEVTPAQRPKVSARAFSVFVRAPSRAHPHHHTWTALKSTNAKEIVKRPKLVLEMRTTHPHSPEVLPFVKVKRPASIEEAWPAVGGPQRHQHHVSFASPPDKHCEAPVPRSTHQAYNVAGNAPPSVSYPIESRTKTEVKSSMVRTEAYKKPVCFYVRSEHTTNPDHRAIYLPQRKMVALVAGISSKFGVASRSVGEISYFNDNFEQMVVDEESIRDLPDGQDMLLHLNNCWVPSNPVETTATTLSYPRSSADHFASPMLLPAEAKNTQAIDEVDETAMFLDLLDFESEPEIPGPVESYPATRHFQTSSIKYQESPTVAPLLLAHHPPVVDFPLWPPNAFRVPNPNLSLQAPTPLFQIAAISHKDISPSTKLWNLGHKHPKRTMTPEINSPQKKPRKTSSSSTSTSSIPVVLTLPNPPMQTQRQSQRSSTRSLSSVPNGTSPPTSASTPATSHSPEPTRKNKSNSKPERRIRVPPSLTHASDLRERNRIAARKCRAERTERTKDLQSVCREAALENGRLRELAGELSGEVAWLRGELGPCGGGGGVGDGEGDQGKQEWGEWTGFG